MWTGRIALNPQLHPVCYVCPSWIVLSRNTGQLSWRKSWLLHIKTRAAEFIVQGGTIIKIFDSRFLNMNISPFLNACMTVNWISYSLWTNQDIWGHYNGLDNTDNCHHFLTFQRPNKLINQENNQQMDCQLEGKKAVLQKGCWLWSLIPRSSSTSALGKNLTQE